MCILHRKIEQRAIERFFMNVDFVAKSIVIEVCNIDAFIKFTAVKQIEQVNFLRLIFEDLFAEFTYLFIYEKCMLYN